MTARTHEQKLSRRMITLLVIGILAGLLIIGLVFIPSPWINPPQCEEFQSPSSGDNCIIGANIGLGFVFGFGFLVSIFSLISLVVFIIIKKLRNIQSALKVSKLLMAPIILLILYIIVSMILSLLGDVF